MGFLSVLSFAHKLIEERVHPGDPVIDATVGNGNDTLFLCKAAAHGKVFGIDIQDEALQQTRLRIEREGLPVSARLELIRGDHADLLRLIPREYHGRIAAVMFNLGYLPKYDHRIITRPETTLPALEAALALLKPGGVLTVMVYFGHIGGREEAEAVESWASILPQTDFQTLTYRFMNQINHPPALIAVEKRESAKHLASERESGSK